MHDIDNKHGHIAKTATTGTEISERLVTGSVNNQEARDFQGHGIAVLKQRQVLLEILLREVCGTNLLRNTTRLASLHIGLAEFIQDFCLTCIDVTQNANNGAAQLALFLALLLLGTPLCKQLFLPLTTLFHAFTSTVKCGL
jgi:hypothetical protein